MTIAAAPTPPNRVTVAAAQRVSAQPDPAALLALVRLEGEVRNAASQSDLVTLIANETRKLTRAQQIIVFGFTVSGKLGVDGVSGMGTPDREAPFVQAIASDIAALHRAGSLLQPKAYSLEGAAGVHGDVLRSYPFQSAQWVPFVSRRKTLLGGMLMLRAEPWSQTDLALAQRLSATYAQAWYWLTTDRKPWSLDKIDKSFVARVGLAVGLIALFPIHLTSLASMEIVPRAPAVVTAGLDAVIEDIPVVSGQSVKPGDVLVKFNDTTFRNRLDVAEREMQVAQSRVKKTTLLAVSDMRARHDLAQARAEYAVKAAELAFARDLLARTTIRASSDGLVILGDKRDLIGRPAAVGERLMDIGDATALEVRIDVPVADAIVLGDDRRAKLFLDSRPLSPVSTTVTLSDYQARATEGGQLTYRVMARWPGDEEAPRLGTRGTAQLYGDRVPLVWTLLRRPFSAMRQWIGL